MTCSAHTHTHTHTHTAEFGRASAPSDHLIPPVYQVVRDYTISQCSEQELRAKQTKVVNALLDARPDGGFRLFGWDHDSFEGWVVRNLSHHMRGALMVTGPASSGRAQAPPREWLAQGDAVAVVLALALGEKTLVEMGGAAEADGDLVGAARLYWAVSLLSEIGHLGLEEGTDHSYHASDLLYTGADSFVGARKYPSSVCSHVDASHLSQRAHEVVAVDDRGAARWPTQRRMSSK